VISRSRRGDASGRDGREPIADAHGAVPEDVGAEPRPVHERSKDAAAVEGIEVSAWLAQAATAAASQITPNITTAHGPRRRMPVAWRSHAPVVAA
jgi:hypothetical protein